MPSSEPALPEARERLCPICQSGEGREGAEGVDVDYALRRREFMLWVRIFATPFIQSLCSLGTGRRFRVLTFVPGGAKGNPPQDVYLLQRS
jgi:hypothetical protein